MRSERLGSCFLSVGVLGAEPCRSPFRRSLNRLVALPVAIAATRVVLNVWNLMWQAWRFLAFQHEAEVVRSALNRIAAVPMANAANRIMLEV